MVKIYHLLLQIFVSEAELIKDDAFEFRQKDMERMT